MSAIYLFFHPVKGGACRVPAVVPLDRYMTDIFDVINLCTPPYLCSARLVAPKFSSQKNRSIIIAYSAKNDSTKNSHFFLVNIFLDFDLLLFDFYSTTFGTESPISVLVKEEFSG